MYGGEHSVSVVSTTLTGNSAGIIGDALASVIDQVDACLVIDTGVCDATINVAMRICGPKLILRRWPWRNDFGAARNAALDFAAGVGADWAITVDPDERMVFPAGFSLSAFLDALPPGTGTVTTHYHTKLYQKERVLRLARDVRWMGSTHECIAEHSSPPVVAEEFTFTELPKDPQTLRHKNERDVVMLREQCALDPLEPRWPLFLGRSLHNLGRIEEALAPLHEAIRLSNWDNDGIMAAYRLVQCYASLKQFDVALALCGQAIEASPTAQEFLFLRDIVHHQQRAAA